MQRIKISDTTIKQSGKSLTFREKIETAKLLEKLNVDVIELNKIENVKADSLLIKSVCSSVCDCVIAVPVGNDEEGVTNTLNALMTAKKPRLQVELPVSDAQMEYILGKKPKAVLELAETLLKSCKEKCEDVEFIAVDATRSNYEFLCEILERSVNAGASTITVCDTAGVFLPHEFADFVLDLYKAVPSLADIVLGAECSNALALADSVSVSAISAGAGEVKTAVHSEKTANLSNLVGIIGAKSDVLNVKTDIKTTAIKRITEQINWMCETSRSANSPFDDGVKNDRETFLNAHDNMDSIVSAVKSLGYDLSPDDNVKVFKEFTQIAEKKETVSAKELDAIVASVALQVPPTYLLDRYSINIGNTISAMAHMRLSKNGVLSEGISLGDGPIDAAFLAIEQIVGQHFELDDFQIKSVTEGREATGESVVKLRSNGKLYSGRGISTDIVGASINAYINALNKIVYEESVN